jgi:hypothetical protein
MAYPSTIYTQTDVAGTTSLSGDDHAARHNAVGDELVAIETALGTHSGTSVLKNFTAGKFAARTIGETFGTNTWIGGTIGTTLIGTSTIQGGTANLVTLGTPTIVGGSVAISGTSVPLTFGAGIVPTSNTYADTAGGTIVVNAQAGNMARIVFGTAAGNRTIGTPANPTSDQSLIIAIQASGSANGTIVWDAGAFNFSDVGTPAIGSASTWNYFSWRYNTLGTAWDYMGQSINVM